jgi:DNA ligase-1
MCNAVSKQPLRPSPPSKRSNSELQCEDDEDDEEPVRKRPRRVDLQKSKKPVAVPVNVNVTKMETKGLAEPKPVKPKCKGAKFSARKTNISSEAQVPSSPASRDVKPATKDTESEVSGGHESSNDVTNDESTSDVEEAEENAESDEEVPEIAAKAREKVQSTLKSNGKDPYPDWPPGDPVPYAALCTTFSLIEMTTKRLIISAHCSLLLRQILRLTPQDLLPTVQLMINKLAADYAGIELGIGESLIMKAIGETTGRSLQVIKADQNEIGDLGLVAAKSRSNQPTMFKPKALTVRGVHDGLMNIAIISGDGSQARKVAGIKKLLSSADAAHAGKGSKGIDINKDKGGASEAKFIIRFLEGKLRLGLAEKTVLVALAHAMVIHETEKKGGKVPSAEQLAKGEAILKTVYR